MTLPPRDAADVLHTHGADVLRDLTDRAARWEPSPPAGRLTEDVPNPTPAHLVSRCAADIVPKWIEFLWPGRIARGKHTAIAGEPGVGKSQLGIYAAATVSRSGAWPCKEGRAPLGNVIIFNAEDGADDTVVPHLMAAGADLKRVHIVNAVLQEAGKGRRTFNLQADLVLLERKIAEIRDVALVIIDPISSYMGKTDSHKNAEVRGALEPLSEMAARLNVAILSITHFSKSGAGNTKALHRFIGSIAFVGAPRAAFAVIEDANNEGRILFLHAKNNMARKQQGLAYRLVQIPVGEQGIIASYVVWDSEPVAMSADDALRAAEHDGDRKALNEAVEFLQDRLSSGAVVPVKEVEEHARALGILPRTLRRARKKVGVKPEKGGLKEGWTLSLPPEGGQETPKGATTNNWPPSKNLAAFEEGQRMDTFEEGQGLAAFEEGQKPRRGPNNNGGRLRENLAAFGDTSTDDGETGTPVAIEPADDDIPASMRRCLRCNDLSDADRGEVTLGRDGRWRHAVCHVLEGPAEP
jgi:hypothetical protein